MATGAGNTSSNRLFPICGGFCRPATQCGRDLGRRPRLRRCIGLRRENRNAQYRQTGPIGGSIHRRSQPIVRLHANPLWAVDRTILLAVAIEAERLGRIEPAVDRSRSRDLGIAAERSRLQYCLRRQMALGNGLGTKAWQTGDSVGHRTT